MGTAQTGTLWRIVSTRMPTKWGMFDAILALHMECLA
jgi:hypothetical protein